MKKDFGEIIKLFENNGVYRLDGDTECVEYYVTNSRRLDISDISEGYVFRLDSIDNKAPAITVHDRTALLLIAKYGVLNFQDLRFAMKLRKQIEPDTCIYEINENSELKSMLDKKLVSKGLVVRCRIKHEYMLDNENITRHGYAYSATAKGINVVNGSMNCILKDSNTFRLLDDVNIRDNVGRMATAHIALYLAQYGFNVLENHYSNVKGGSVERYALLSYNSNQNIEVLFQPLYFVRNTKIETEVEFNEKIKNLVNNVFRWVAGVSEFEKDGEAAKRIVVLACNSIKDYVQFCNFLIDFFSLRDFFDLVGCVYATSTGIVDAARTPDEAFYRHTSIADKDGKRVPVGGEMASFFNWEET